MYSDIAMMRSARLRPRSALVGLVFCLAGPAAGHDSFLVADANLLSEPGPTALRFITTDAFPKGDAPTKPDRVMWFEVRRDEFRAPVREIVQATDALTAVFEPEVAGVYTIGIALHPRFIEIEGAAFTKYLAEEKATGVIAARAASGKDRSPGLELFCKLSKTFVDTGGVANDRTYEAPIGHPLEIVPLNNPCRLGPGQPLRVRVLLDGEPAPGMQISSGFEGGGAHVYEQSVKTNEKGEAVFLFSRAGLWYLRTHVIRPMREEPPPNAQGVPEGKRPEWASFFASMTLRVNEK